MAGPIIKSAAALIALRQLMHWGAGFKRIQLGKTMTDNTKRAAFLEWLLARLLFVFGQLISTGLGPKFYPLTIRRFAERLRGNRCS